MKGRWETVSKTCARCAQSEILGFFVSSPVGLTLRGHCQRTVFGWSKLPGMPVWIGYAVVFLGGGVGAAARHGVNRAAAALAGPNYPWGTLAVNVMGCLVMGMLTSWFAFRGETAPQPLRLLLTTGVLGGFTTFSAFSAESLALLERGRFELALAHTLAHVVGALACAALGARLMRFCLS